MRSGSRFIEPSSLTTSHSVAAGRRPASRARSTAASVWPARRSTPPSAARSGKTCPGLVRSSGEVRGSASSRMVCARSAAEMPVVVLSRASTETVNAVCLRSSLWWCIGGSPSRSQSPASSGTQSTPLVQRTMKPTTSGVASSAATIRSPSFSRSSSSTTTTGRPAATAARACSTVPNMLTASTPPTGRRSPHPCPRPRAGQPAGSPSAHLGPCREPSPVLLSLADRTAGCGQQPLHVLGDHVDLEVDPAADRGPAERGDRERGGDERDGEEVRRPRPRR